MPKPPILLTDEIPAPPALVRLGIETLPATIGARNERTRLRFIQFFTANIRNRNTRRARRRFFRYMRRLPAHRFPQAPATGLQSSRHPALSVPHLCRIKELIRHKMT